jgi:hypothetical protein
LSDRPRASQVWCWMKHGTGKGIYHAGTSIQPRLTLSVGARLYTPFHRCAAACPPALRLLQSFCLTAAARLCASGPAQRARFTRPTRHELTLLRVCSSDQIAACSIGRSTIGRSTNPLSVVAAARWSLHRRSLHPFARSIRSLAPMSLARSLAMPPARNAAPR